MNQEKQIEEIGGEDGWELDAAEEAALSAAWERERTPEFLARVKRQEAEYDIWRESYQKKSRAEDAEDKC